MFQLRTHQQQAVAAALEKPHGGTLTAVVPPGGGKTVLALAVLDALYKAGRIDAALVLTPRLGLCSQFELDWKSVRNAFQPGALGAVLHRENSAIDGLRAGGYVTSYQSLCADPVVHRRFARRRARRLAIVCDEAHYLGQKLHGAGDTTQAAKILAELDEYAAFKIVMTGTPYRSDENPIVFAQYDHNGKIVADVEISYADGVAQGFLCPFDAMLFDGKMQQTRRRQRQGKAFYASEEVELRFTSQQLSKIALDPHFWQVAARHAFEKVKELQELWPRYCGIAGCATQEHARDVLAYLESLGARCLLAVSDDSSAHNNLRTFKNGGWDMLVTVGMAHVGYDYKPIAVAAVLNGIREFNWLDQFTMRAGRVVPNRPRTEQTAWIYGMNDLAMRRYVNDKRSEASRAIKLAEEMAPSEGDAAWSNGDQGHSLLYHGVTLESISGIGFGHNGYLAELEEEEVAPITEKEMRENLRRRRQGLVNHYAAQHFGQVNGDTIRKVNALLLTRYGKPVNQCTPEEVEAQIQWLESELGAALEKDASEPYLDDAPLYVQGTLF